MQDLAALTPPFVMCAAFLIGVWFVLRRELGGKRRPQRRDKRPPDGDGS